VRTLLYRSSISIQLDQERVMRRRLPPILVVFGLLINAVAWAQEPVDRDMIAKIKDEGLNHAQVEETFTHFTEDIGPRLTGGPAHRRAAEWARDKLKDWGLSDAHLEPFEFGRGWTQEKLTVEMVEPRYLPLSGFAEAWSPSMSKEVVAAPVFIGDKTEQAITEMQSRLKGAIVLSQPIQTVFERADRPQPTLFDKPVAIGQPRRNAPPPLVNRQTMTKLLSQARPAVVLRPNFGEHGTLFVQGVQNREATVPSIVLSSEHYNLIARMIQRGTPVKLRVKLKTRFLTEDKNSYNVIAELPGTDPVLRDEIVMIGAHLDSWHAGTGATDNADGSAVVMEAMRILKAIGARPKRTIRVALWSGEEEGLLGSKAYVTSHLSGEANKAVREKYDVYFNLDPGTGPIYGWYLENNEPVRSIFDAWLDQFHDVSARKNIIQPIGNTDHLSFIAVGIPGFNAVQDYTNYDVREHHTNVDTFERVNLYELRQCAIVMASFAYLAAMRTEKIPFVAPPPTPTPTPAR
jgi:carboxypeptidase Q